MSDKSHVRTAGPTVHWQCELDSDSVSESIPGYHGRYLRIDLSRRSVESVDIPPNVLREYIGGSGLGTWLLLQETPRPRDAISTSGAGPGAASPEPDESGALAADMPLVICFSPLVGTPLTTSAKFALLAKSPLTGRINDSLSSSTFAIAGKKTGFDALVIRGATESAACLVIEPDEVRMISADVEWGLSPRETELSLRVRLGAGYQVVSIGPAGERLVWYATISHDGRHAGRGGLGAVMGSKRLKAIAVRGDRTTPVAHAAELARYAKDLSQRSFGAATAKYRELGTVSNLLTFNRLGALPTRNFQQGTFSAAESLSPESTDALIPRTRASCAACTIGCEHIFHPQGADQPGVRMEYENLFALGPLCGIDDPRAVLEASRLCDELGLDTISAGGSVAFAMECAERGLIHVPDLRFGSAEALLATLRQIGRREGLGELLSHGVRYAAREIGGGAESFAIHVKGLELPGYEPRAMQTMALGFAVGSRGADHNRSGAYQVDFSEQVNRLAPADDAVALAIETENEAAVMDALILCKFLRGVFDDRFAAMAEMLKLITGWDVTASELQDTANRIVTTKKRYNIQQGWTPAEDSLPERFFTTPLPDGAGAGVQISRERLGEMIRQYNLARGWTADGYTPLAFQSAGADVDNSVEWAHGSEP